MNCELFISSNKAPNTSIISVCNGPMAVLFLPSRNVFRHPRSPDLLSSKVQFKFYVLHDSPSFL